MQLPQGRKSGPRNNVTNPLHMLFISKAFCILARDNRNCRICVIIASLSLLFAVPCASPNYKRTENSAIPCRDGCPIQVIPSRSSAKNLSRRNARAVYLYI